MFDRIRADIESIYSSLHNTIYSLIVRGESLRSLTDKSEELELYALELEIKGKMAKEQLLIEAGIKIRRRNHFLCVALVVLMCVGGILYGYTYIQSQR